jgi:two-component system response regulator CpxR
MRGDPSRHSLEVARRRVIACNVAIGKEDEKDDSERGGDAAEEQLACPARHPVVMISRCPGRCARVLQRVSQFLDLSQTGRYNTLDKVLVVDDDPAVRALLEIVGTRAGFTVDTAVDGLEALEKLRNEPYLILVVDLMMPRVNGYDVVQQLRNEPRRPGIVVVTAMTGSYIEKLDPEIVQSIVRKPFDVDMFAAVLTEVAITLKRPRQQMTTDPAVTEAVLPPVTRQLPAC